MEMSKRYFGQPEGYMGGAFESSDSDGNLTPSQPTLSDAGTAMFFPDIVIDGPGTLKISCSMPLRDYRDVAGERFKGCDVLWQNVNEPAHVFRTTIGTIMTVPGVYVSKTGA